MASIVEKSTGANLNYKVGTVVEIPHLYLRAGDFAEYAEYFSFGTNILEKPHLG